MQYRQIQPQQKQTNTSLSNYLWIVMIGLIILIVGYSFMSVYESLEVSNDNLVNAFEIKSNGLCRSSLGYSYININPTNYYLWYGLVGTSTSGRDFQTGHLIDRHIAVNNKCTQVQISQKKTIFLNKDEMAKAVGLDQVSCDFTNQKIFTYNQSKKIVSPSDYVRGLDCSKANPQIELFSGFFIEYKRSLQNKAPPIDQYLKSTTTTIWTVYPERK